MNCTLCHGRKRLEVLGKFKQYTARCARCKGTGELNAAFEVRRLREALAIVEASVPMQELSTASSNLSYAISKLGG